MSIEQIRARAAESVSNLTSGAFTMHDGLAAVGDRKTILAAVDAVLALHVPDTSDCCEECYTPDGGWKQHPCPTVAAITEALEGTK